MTSRFFCLKRLGPWRLFIWRDVSVLLICSATDTDLLFQLLIAFVFRQA
jgi:hypothetical protein